MRPENTISEKERHPGTAPDSISGLYAANLRLLYSAYLMIQTHSYQYTPLGFAYRLPIGPTGAASIIYASLSCGRDAAVANPLHAAHLDLRMFTHGQFD